MCFAQQMKEDHTLTDDRCFRIVMFDICWHSGDNIHEHMQHLVSLIEMAVTSSYKLLKM